MFFHSQSNIKLNEWKFVGYSKMVISNYVSNYRVHFVSIRSTRISIKISVNVEEYGNKRQIETKITLNALKIHLYFLIYTQRPTARTNTQNRKFYLSLFPHSNLFLLRYLLKSSIGHSGIQHLLNSYTFVYKYFSIAIKCNYLLIFAIATLLILSVLFVCCLCDFDMRRIYIRIAVVGWFRFSITS